MDLKRNTCLSWSKNNFQSIAYPSYSRGQSVQLILPHRWRDIKVSFPRLQLVSEGLVTLHEIQNSEWSKNVIDKHTSLLCQSLTNRLQFLYHYLKLTTGWYYSSENKNANAVKIVVDNYTSLLYQSLTNRLKFYIIN